MLATGTSEFAFKCQVGFWFLTKRFFKKPFQHCCANTGIPPLHCMGHKDTPTVSKGSSLLCQLFRIIIRETQGSRLVQRSTSCTPRQECLVQVLTTPPPIQLPAGALWGGSGKRLKSTWVPATHHGTELDRVLSSWFWHGPIPDVAGIW